MAMTMREILAALSQQYDGDWAKIMASIQNKETPKVGAQALTSKEYVTIIDDAYPAAFKNTIKPPFVLYYKGDLNLIHNDNYKHTLSISGARDCQMPYTVLDTIISELKADTIIATGGAIGTDTKAINDALDRGLKVVVVLPCGLNNPYPKTNAKLYEKVVEKGGLLITEYPCYVDPTHDNFLMRDRLIAAMAPKLLATEVHPKSGTLATVSLALQDGHNIYTIPTYPTDGILNNTLIKKGAYVVEHAKDLEEDN